MINQQWAERFAREWAANWHAKDLEALLGHYSPDIVFRSPRISAVLGKPQASVAGLAELRDYWRKALDAAKEVRFEVASIGVGSDALTILYKNQRDDHVAETLVFDEQGKIIQGIVVYVKPFEG
jgi:ketosteroid isomerase-like protein